MTRDVSVCLDCNGIVLCRCDEPETETEEHDPHDLLGAVATTRGMIESHAKLIRQLGEDAVKRDKAFDAAIDSIAIRLRSLDSMMAALQNAFNMRATAFKERDD